MRDEWFYDYQREEEWKPKKQTPEEAREFILKLFDRVENYKYVLNQEKKRKFIGFVNRLRRFSKDHGAMLTARIQEDVGSLILVCRNPLYIKDKSGEERALFAQLFQACDRVEFMCSGDGIKIYMELDLRDMVRRK